MKIRCFGRVGVEIGGASVSLGPQQRALLAALVAAGPNGLSADEISSDLWPNGPPKSEKSSIRMLIRRLRQKVDCIESIDGRYALTVEPETVDTWRFLGLTPRTAALAIELWSGELFAGIEPTDRILAECARLEERRLALVKDMAWSVAPGEREEVLDYVLQAIDEDPYHEALAASGAAALYRLGRQADALAVVSRCRNRLRDDLGLDAGAELREVEHAVLSQNEDELGTRVRAESQLPDRAPLHLSLSADQRFVGRGSEGAVLRDALAESRGGPGRIVIVVGDAGAGKSALVERFVSAQFVQGTTIRIGIGGADHNVAYEPLIQALPELVAEMTKIHEVIDPTVGRLRFWQEAERALARLGGAGPTVVVLEDLHLADSQTNAFLRYMASAALPANLLFIATSRPPESGSLWEQTLTALIAGSQTTKISLGALAEEEIAQLVEEDHPNEQPLVKRRLAKAIAAESGGHALVAAILSQGTLLLQSPEIADDTRASASDSQRYRGHVDTIEKHLVEKVDADTAELLSVASVVGLEFQLEVLVDLVDSQEATVLRLLERAMLAGICNETATPDLFKFSHALTAAAFGRRISKARSRRISAKLADHPASRHRDLVRYVRQAEGSVDPATAVPILMQAAAKLRSQMAFFEASSTLDLIANMVDEGAAVLADDQRFEVVVQQAECLSRLGDLARATSSRELAFSLAGEDNDRRCRVALAGLPSAEFTGGDPDRLAMLDQVDAEAVTTFSDHRLRSLWARQARINERPELAVEVLANADDAEDVHGLVALERLLIAAAGNSATRILADLRALGSESQESEVRAAVRHRELIAALTEHESNAATDLFDEVSAELQTIGSARQRWILHALETALVTVGMRDSSATTATALDAGMRFGIPDAFDAWGVQLFVQMWVDEQLPQALAMLDAAGDSIVWNVAWGAAAALSAAAAGETARAKKEVATVLREFRRAPVANWNAIGAGLLIEAAALLHDKEAAVAGREMLATRSGQSLILGIGLAHLGPVDRYLGLAAAVLDDSDGIPYLTKALTQAETIGSGHWTTRTKKDLTTIGALRPARARTRD